MSAAANGQTVGIAERGLAGRTRISTTALTSVARAAAAEALGVAPPAVRVTWTDDAGALALSLSSPISAPSLDAVPQGPGRQNPAGVSILTRATEAKAGILAVVEQLTGSRLSRVDIRISGLRATGPRRVL